jgi:hypothetical protein
MSPDDDRIFDALAALPPVTPDTEWEVRVQARCRSAISERVALRRQGKRYRAGLPFISAAAVLCAYMVAMFAQALRLAHF